MTQELHLWVEGRTDASEHSGGDGDPETYHRGALIPLLTKTLRELLANAQRPVEADLPDVRVHLLRERLRANVGFQGASAAVGGLKGFARKLAIALVNARAKEGQDVIIAVVDRDGRKERTRERNALNEHLRATASVGFALALCVEMIEAWLLADPAAFVRCFGTGPAGGISGDPEKLPNPKQALLEVLSRYKETTERARSEVYAALAEHVDLTQLAERCPIGYARFREDLRDLIVPVLE
jgi:hypothetical protein